MWVGYVQKLILSERLEHAQMVEPTGSWHHSPVDLDTGDGGADSDFPVPAV